MTTKIDEEKNDSGDENPYFRITEHEHPKHRRVFSLDRDSKISRYLTKIGSDRLVEAIKTKSSPKVSPKRILKFQSPKRRAQHKQNSSFSSAILKFPAVKKYENRSFLPP